MGNNRKHSLMAMLLAVLVAASMMPIVTLDAFALTKDVDFTIK